MSRRIRATQFGKSRINDSGPIAYGGAGNADLLYVGSRSTVFVRQQARPAPLTASVTYPGNRDVLGIAVDPDHPRIAFVMDDSNVYRTPDAGTKWKKITGNLPTLGPLPLRSVVYSTGIGGEAVVVGANTGVFVTSGPGFSHWSRLGSGLPTVPVLRLKYSAKDKILVAATLGSGASTLDLSGKKAP